MENFKTRFSEKMRCRFEQQTKEPGATDVLGSNTCEITQRNLGMFLSRGGKIDSPAGGPLHTNAHSLCDEQEEPEVIGQLESDNLIFITET